MKEPYEVGTTKCVWVKSTSFLKVSSFQSSVVALKPHFTWNVFWPFPHFSLLLIFHTLLISCLSWVALNDNVVWKGSCSIILLSRTLRDSSTPLRNQIGIRLPRYQCDRHSQSYRASSSNARGLSMAIVDLFVRVFMIDGLTHASCGAEIGIGKTVPWPNDVSSQVLDQLCCISSSK